jgi:hypothetical protein
MELPRNVEMTTKAEIRLKIELKVTDLMNTVSI